MGEQAEQNLALDAHKTHEGEGWRLASGVRYSFGKSGKV
jgi:hypothetical protein